MNTVGNEKYLMITNNYLNKCKRTYPKGSIVYPKNGGAIFTNKRRILYQESVVDLNTGGFIHDDKLILEYAYILFNTINFSMIYKGTALPTVDQKLLKQYSVPLPSLEEQQRIVDRLNELNVKIDKCC